MSDNRRNATLKALIDAAITELMIKTSGEQIYLDDNTTLSSKMAEMVTAINLRDKKTDVDAKIKTVTDSLNSTSESLSNDISTLRSEKADKTEVTEQITALKQEIMGDLPVEAYDTFTELAAYIEEHQEAADALTAAVGNKADKTVVDDILTVINGLGALANKDKVAKDDLDASLQTELDAKATTEAMNTALATKSNTSHTHDDRYYTKAETDTAIANAPKGDTGVWISQADYDALSDEDKALDLTYYIYDAKSNSGSDSGSSGISISQAEYDALSAEEKASETTYYIYDANSNPNAASIPFTSENYTATNVGAALEEVNGNLRSSLNTTLKGKIIDGTLTAASSVSTLPYKFIAGSAVVLNNEIHILGSAYDSAQTNHYKWDGTSWTEVSTLPYAFYQASAVVLNNEIHILGSGHDSSDTTNYTKHYKWDGTSWTSVSTLPYTFSNGSAVVLNNEIHILGCGEDTPNKHYKWSGTSWTSVSTLPYNFIAGSAVVYNNEIHILGGGDNSNTYTKHYKWDGTSWTEISTLPYNFILGSAVVYNNEIHILGSAVDSNTYTKHYKWSGTSWTSVSTLPYNFYGGSAVVYNNEIHIFGSADNSISSAIYTNHYKIDTGQSILTLTDSAIKEDSILDIYVSQYGVSPTSVTSEVGSVTLTFGKLDNDLNVKVVIM